MPAFLEVGSGLIELIRMRGTLQTLNKPALRTGFVISNGLQKQASDAAGNNKAPSLSRGGLLRVWGRERIRTAVQGFADLCLTARPPVLIRGTNIVQFLYASQVLQTFIFENLAIIFDSYRENQFSASLFF